MNERSFIIVHQSRQESIDGVVVSNVKMEADDKITSWPENTGLAIDK
jgi:hypothetical protein